jgi:hypothetical protein
MSDAHVETTAQNLTWTRSALYRLIYCQLFRTRITPGDITLTVSTLTDQRPGQTDLTVEDQAAIVMSWPEMKMLVQQLSVIVAAIEQDIGPIPIPRGYLPTVEAQLPVIQSLGLSKPNDSAQTEAE